MWQFTAVMPVWWYVLVTSLARFGIGAIGTITTLVAQLAVGAIFFFQMMGLVVAPSILRLVQSSTPGLESGLKLVFLIGAVAMAIALLMIITIPEISMDAGIAERNETSAMAVPLEG